MTEPPAGRSRPGGSRGRATRGSGGVSRPLVVAIFGAFFMLYAGWQSYRLSVALAGLAEGSGTILSWQAITDEKGRTLNYALVRFTTKDGKVVTSRAQPGEPKAGTANVPTVVTYNKANPVEVSLGRPNNVYTMPLTFAGVGFLVLLYGLYGYRHERRRKAASNSPGSS